VVAYSNPDEDVPSPIDLRTEEDAHAWANAAESARPWRAGLRHRIAEIVSELPHNARVLELGSGPGFLAECVLDQCPNVTSYTLFDFSEPMLSMSRARLARFPAAQFIHGDFKSADWFASLQAPYSAVLAMQAVHEIRHKRHAPLLYRQVRSVLAPGGQLLVCDHIPKDSSLRWTSLHMTAQEQLDALTTAGFHDARIDQTIERMVLAVGRTAA
jgi:ubiquinone/menaquinone biosynthesis C-methylase UbiE